MPKDKICTPRRILSTKMSSPLDLEMRLREPIRAILLLSAFPNAYRSSSASSSVSIVIYLFRSLLVRQSLDFCAIYLANSINDRAPTSLWVWLIVEISYYIVAIGRAFFSNLDKLFSCVWTYLDSTLITRLGHIVRYLISRSKCDTYAISMLGSLIFRYSDCSYGGVAIRSIAALL